METTLARLKVGHETVTDNGQAARLTKIRAALPHQQVFSMEAALQFGLPMTGEEIHQRVIATVAWWRGYAVNVAIWAIVCISLGGSMFGYTMSYAYSECRSYYSSDKSKTTDCEFGTVVGRTFGSALLAIGAILLIGGLAEWTTSWRYIDSYDHIIPDQALLRYDEAKQSGLFHAFFVVEPVLRQYIHKDPWLVGSLIERSGNQNELSTDNRRAYIVLAYWA